MQGAVVCEALPRGEAARGGVRVGDMLVAVDDHLVTDSDHALLLFAASARAVRLVLWRPARSDANVAPLVATRVASAEKDRPVAVQGGTQAWGYYTQDARTATSTLIAVYEDITA